MGTSSLNCRGKIYFTISVILLPALAFSQSRYSRHLQPEGFSLKTDALGLLQSAIDQHSKSYAISGEIYFNHDYSLNITPGITTDEEQWISQVTKRITFEFRWYLLQEDCSCSAFFAGAFLGYNDFRQTVVPANVSTNATNYSLTTFEGGVCAGYQAVFYNHFVIDPSAQAGLSFHRNNKSTESLNSLQEPPAQNLLLRVQLGIGYRF